MAGANVSATTIIRPATIDDVEAISEVRVAAWRAAYQGLIAEKFLAGMDPVAEAAQRAADWDSRNNVAELVAERVGEVIGWAVVGHSRSEHWPDVGELYALYVHPDYWSGGVGHALMAAGEAALRQAGYACAYLLVLRGNDRAANFYQRHGWVEDGTEVRDERFSGVLIERRRVRDLRACT